MGWNKSDFKSLKYKNKEICSTHQTPFLFLRNQNFNIFLCWCDWALVKLTQKMQNYNFFGPFPEYLCQPAYGLNESE